eukprot:scaffold105382_cov61-Phaeocystis_antarctica.AAC.4
MPVRPPPHLSAYGSRSAALPTRHVAAAARAFAASCHPRLLPSRVRAVAHEASEAAGAARGLRGGPRGQTGCEEGGALGRAGGLRCCVGRAVRGRARGDTDERGGGAWQALDGLGTGGASGVGFGADLRDRPRLRRADERSRDAEPRTADPLLLLRLQAGGCGRWRMAGALPPQLVRGRQPAGRAARRDPGLRLLADHTPRHLLPRDLRPQQARPLYHAYMPLSPYACMPLLGRMCGARPLVYLTADAPEALDVIDADTVYVIGGLVDRSREKGLTLARARAAGIATARLPLAEHLQLGLEQHRSLAVNHVFEIVMHRARGLEWGDAMLKGMPPRRGATRKDDDGGGEDRAGV